MFMDRDPSLWFRLGWTHPVLAMVVLPIARVLLLIDRVVARLHGHEPGARAGPVLGLSTSAVVSHPLLDWLDSYGVRLLMPFRRQLVLRGRPLR